MSARSRPTPVRDALAAQSTIKSLVQDGIGAIKDKDKKFIDASIRTQFADSLDTDEAFTPAVRKVVACAFDHPGA